MNALVAVTGSQEERKIPGKCLSSLRTLSRLSIGRVTYFFPLMHDIQHQIDLILGASLLSMLLIESN